jgi:hypothetical protein
MEKSAADIKTEEIAQYIGLLEKQLISVTKHADNLVKRSRDVSLAFLEFGQGFTFMGQSEGDTVGSALLQVTYRDYYYTITFTVTIARASAVSSRVATAKAL